jgi:hypothetical protein
MKFPKIKNAIRVTKILFTGTIMALCGSCCFVTGYIFYKSNRPSEEKLNLVFDLDHTLIHAEKDSTVESSNITLFRKEDSQISFQLNDKIRKYYVWKRPFCTFTLSILSKFNNVYLYTAASKDYADKICDELNLDKYFIKKYYSREYDDTCKNLKYIIQDDNKAKLCAGDIIPNSDIGEYDAKSASVPQSRQSLQCKPFDVTPDGDTINGALLCAGGVIQRSGVTKDLKNTILIDDRNFNKCSGQHFYHISPYHLYKKYDFELLKLFGKVIYMNIFGINTNKI